MHDMIFRLVILALVAVACGSASDDGTAPTPTSSGAPTSSMTVPPVATTGTAAQGCADVIGVEVRGGADGFSFDVTVRSDDTGWDKYADAWEVRDPEGFVLGTRVLAHPHENEQPFTRSLGGVSVPDSVTEITVAARDSVLGFCGAAFTVPMPGRS